MARLRCARCGKHEAKRVVYGYPSPELLEEATRGEVVLGGCDPGAALTKWLCDACNSQMTELERFQYLGPSRR